MPANNSTAKSEPYYPPSEKKPKISSPGKEAKPLSTAGNGHAEQAEPEPHPPCPKNWDMEKEAKPPTAAHSGHAEQVVPASRRPCPSFRDTKIGYSKNWDIISNNSNTNNSYSKISLSSAGEKGLSKSGTDGQGILERLCRELPSELKWVEAMTEDKRDALLGKFHEHISGRIDNRKIRDLSGYLRASMLNWLRDLRLRENLADGQRQPRQGLGVASYEIGELERMAEDGLF